LYETDTLESYLLKRFSHRFNSACAKSHKPYHANNPIPFRILNLKDCIYSPPFRK
jgi:hypothetical protein